MIRHDSDRAKLDEGCVFNEAAGRKVIDFIERFLCLENGEPFKILPWQHDFIHSVYSWIRPDACRATKLGLLTLGRKNGKSALTYGLTAYHLIADGEMSPSCVSCAVDKEQAGQIFKWFKFAKERNPQLDKCLHPVSTKKTIEYPARNGMYRSLASVAAGNFGHGHSFVIHDELAFHPKDDLYTALKNSTDARKNGLQIITSTAGWNKNGAFYKLVQYGRKVLSGAIIDTTFQPWIYEVPEGADLEDRRNWYLANPSLGVSQSEYDFAGQWEREKRDITTRLAFLRLKFNMWTDAENVWIPPEDWEACKGSDYIPPDCPVVMGVDVGATRDLTAISLVGKVADKYIVKSWGFVPEGYIKCPDNVNTPRYQAFQLDKSLTITKGSATDETALLAFIDKLRKEYNVKTAVMDRWNSLFVANHMRKAGIEPLNFPQTHTYFNGPCLMLERLVNDRKIFHNGNPLLAWQIGHTFLDREAGKGYVKPMTMTPAQKKDNLISLLMALSQTLQTSDIKPSVYTTRQPLII